MRGKCRNLFRRAAALLLAAVMTVLAGAQPALAASYQIMSVPTMLLFKNGEMIQRISGYQPKPQLSAFIKQFI